MSKMMFKMGQIPCKLEQFFRETEGSFREVERNFSTNAGFVHMYVHLEKSFWSFA